MPDYAEAHLNLGLCYLLIGDYEKMAGESTMEKETFKRVK